MLGWHVSIYRLAELKALAAIPDVPSLSTAFPTLSDQVSLLGSLQQAKSLAVWQIGLYGLKWMDDLVRGRLALRFPGNGYPNVFLALARDLLPRILPEPPEANLHWTCGAHDILGPGWAGKTVIDHEEVGSTRPEEWLCVEVWDES
jgi:hypothetical protein